MARLGVVRQGFTWQAVQGVARKDGVLHGQARFGRHGSARCGGARRGEAGRGRAGWVFFLFLNRSFGI